MTDSHTARTNSRGPVRATLSAEQASPRGGELSVVTTDAGRILLKGRARTAATGIMR